MPNMETTFGLLSTKVDEGSLPTTPACQPGSSATSSVFPFLSLPVEIRCQIYRLLLLSSAEWIRPIPPWIANHMPRLPRSYKLRPWPFPRNGPDEDEYTFYSNVMDSRLFLICKQIYREALPVWLEENPFVIEVGACDEGEYERKIENVLQHARVLALKVNVRDEDLGLSHTVIPTWARILQRRTNIRTIRVRLLNANMSLFSAWQMGCLAYFENARRDLSQIRACAVVTVDCDDDGWLRAYGEHGQPGKVKEMLLWLEKEIASKMRKEGCPCSKRKDGRHVERVAIGRNGDEVLAVEVKE